MRTQKEINHYLQRTTIKNARHLLDIESCIRNNNLRLPNNVIIHENGISFVEFCKWFENRCLKEGDICTTILGIIFIYQLITVSNMCGSYVSVDNKGILNRHYDSFPEDCCRPATEEEKQKLFDAIKANGYKWNAETKTLEKLIVPKFKVGDKIKEKNERFPSTRTIYDYVEGIGYSTTIHDWVRIEDQDEWELVPNKFDINTLKPFDKVLVRCSELEIWHISFFEKYNRKYSRYPFVCLNGNKYSQCIPYKDNEHLLDTADNCNDFYKT